MKLNEDLSMEATKWMAQLRRNLQDDLNKVFKLSENDQVMKMLKYAELSEDDKVTSTLDCFLAELPEDKRAVLSEKGINGTLPPVKASNGSASNADKPQAQNGAEKKPARMYRGRPVSD